MIERDMVKKKRKVDKNRYKCNMSDIQRVTAKVEKRSQKRECRKKLINV